MANGTKIVTLKNGYHLWTHTENSPKKIKMIAVHGGPGDTHESFEGVPAFLPDIQVSYYDQLGSWYSDQPNFNDRQTAKKFLNIDYFVNELEEVRAALGYEKFVLLGYSWGAMIAFEYALKYPDKLSHLIIIGMSAVGSDFDKQMQIETARILGKSDFDYVFAQADAGNFNDLRYQQLMGKFYQAYYNRFSSSQTKHVADISNHQVSDRMMGKNPFSTAGELAGWNVENRLSSIKTPALLMVGDQDLISVAAAKKTAQKLSHSVFKVIKKATHVSLRDNPQEIFENIKNFLENS